MFMVPYKEKGIDDEEAPLEAIGVMNQMIKFPINKIPSFRFGHWIGLPSLKKTLLPVLPEDVDLVDR